MKWIEDYATGVERIDEQHKMIFKMAEDFRAALDEDGGMGVYPTLLESLSLYCDGHFSFEEECMAEHECPVAHKNERAHIIFLQVLSGFKKRYALVGYDSADARKLVDTIDMWLADHICNIDVHLKNCVN
jgi:hemerythrin